MAVPCFAVPRGIYNLLWLLFIALSFLWFPYIGMVTLPCRRKETDQSSSSVHPARSILQYPTGRFDYRKTIPVSVHNSTFTELMQDQQQRLASFCSSENMPTTVYDEPAVHDLYHHILVDDERKILFCYVPKVGCSNWKRVFLILAGLVDPSERLRPSIEIFRRVTSLINYSPKEQEYRLRKYFKFMFIRHPQERTLSAYRNKIEHPIKSNPSEQNIWDDVRFSILSFYRMKFNDKMVAQEDVYPTFGEFIHFLYDSESAFMNEHYKPMVELCQPCAVKYHFVGNFGLLREHANAVLDHLRINSSLFWDRGKHLSKPTSTYITDYFSKLRPIDISRLESKFGHDIALYNHLYPYEYDGGYTEVRNDIMKKAITVD